MGRAEWCKSRKAASALTLHNAQFDLMERTPYIAARQGSMLLRAVLSALQGNAASGQLTGPMPPNDAAFVAFVGHDTNLANLGAMIEAEWSATPQVPDQTAPASALVFELRLQANGARDVYVYYLAQSLAQMRERTALTAARRSENHCISRVVAAASLVHRASLRSSAPQ